MIAQQKFPKDFLWGASTASHQVEGGTVNQWSVWELEQAADLAAGAEKRLANVVPNWQAIQPLATDPDNYVSGAGVDHYNRYEEDFDLLEKLQFNAFRFGIEWSRIEPAEGVFNAEAIKHYHDYIDSLKHRGITPVLNLWHWTMPTWFTDKGGFEQEANVALFAAFVEKVVQEYADKVNYFITLNEPNVYVSEGYILREWPPQRKGYRLAFRVYRNLVLAHHRAYTMIKAANPAAQVGIAAQLANVQAKRPHNLVDGAVTKAMRYGWNWWFLNRIRQHQDFVGINYYFTDYYRGTSKASPHVPLNDMGWYMEPEGLYPLLLRTWARYKKPIIVTENGVADRNDDYRQWWLEQTVIAMQRALSEGVDIRGYMHWSLLDNFEWAYGWWPKFGLIAVDREHGMKRTPRPSAIWFARYLAELQGKTIAKTARSSAMSKAAESTSPASPAVVAKPAAKVAAASVPTKAVKSRTTAARPVPAKVSAATATMASLRSRINRAARRPAKDQPTTALQPKAGRPPRRLNLERFRSKIQ